MRVPFATPLFTIALCVLASSGFAATDTPVTAAKGGIVGLEAMTSTVFQEGQSSFSGIGLRLRIRNATFRPNLELLPTMEYWQNTSHLAAFDIRTKRRDATLGSDLRWVFDNKKAWQPYAGVGFALHFLDDELQVGGRPKETSGVVRGGVAALAGVEFGMTSRLGSFVEFKYHSVSHYRQLKFNTGLSWNF